MKNIALEVENLSKQYRLGQVGTGTLSHDLNRWWHKIRGKEDPYLKIGESNDRTQKGESDYVWALRDINFQIEQGDAVGIIGRNGAGKSTLLKLLSKITVRGRIASLLEVGTGFHPEMTGRENIYLNGAILGMTRREITRKFDEIVDFAGVERYIDTPVKRYSSGMYVRLAFAVAAHLESEILIVDEVLAVGDAEFQKKCLGKMGDVSKGEGRTVLFVSHNIGAVKELCNSGLLMRNGNLALSAQIDYCISEYQKSFNQLSYYNSNDLDRGFENQNIKVKKFKAAPIQGSMINVKSGIRISIEFENKIDEVDLDLSFYLRNKMEDTIFSTGLIVSNKQNIILGDYLVSFDIPPYMLNEDDYYFEMFWGVNRSEIAYKFTEFGFEVSNVENQFGEIIKSPGILYPNITYQVNKI
jgi:lipopolysaccharide transport system ATP-binding protein